MAASADVQSEALAADLVPTSCLFLTARMQSAKSYLFPTLTLSICHLSNAKNKV